MKSLRRIILLIVVFTVVASAVKADDFGYCTSSTDRTHIFRVGSSERQGLAIRLSHEKLVALKGCTISTISAAFGSKRMTGGSVNLFITTDLSLSADRQDDTALRSETGQVTSATKWLTFAFNEPYTITGEEECLYVGYTGEISVGSTMLMADFTADGNGTSFAFCDGEWIDMCGMGYGNASIRVGVDDAPQVSDLMLKPFDVEGYYRAGQRYAITGQLFNFGNQTVNHFDLTINGITQTIENVEIKQGETYDFELNNWTTDVDGDVCLTISVGNAGDVDMSDNLFSDNVFIYPAEMQRTLLVEGFTGQACSNCPAGHAVMQQFIQSCDIPCIEVMHHAGYSPDYFTTEADLDYTYFYGSLSTYAPAVMINRTTVVGTVPVMNTTVANLNAAEALFARTQPYVSLALESHYDAATREVTVTLNTLAHRDLPCARPVFNLLLVQNNLVSKQALGGDFYTHNAVLRQVITGNSWGIEMLASDAKAGGRGTWTETFTLPEAIVSDYEGKGSASEQLRTWPTVPEDMYIVAYVAAHGNTPSDCQVFNAIAVPLGGAHSQGGYEADVTMINESVITTLYRLDGTAVRSEASSGLYIQGGRKIMIR